MTNKYRNSTYFFLCGFREDEEVEEVKKNVYYKERVSARLHTRRKTLSRENSILNRGFCYRCKLFADLTQAIYF
jgi:hypothetical protein